MAEKPAAAAEEDMEAEKENVSVVEEPPPPVKLQFCTFPPLTPEDEALIKMVDLQKMGRSHKVLPVAPDGFIPNSEVRKLYGPIDSSQQLVPIGATPLDIEAILRKKQTISRTHSEEDQLNKTLQHYMADEKMREVSFADAVVDASDTTAALAQRINSDEIRRDILDTFYENLDKEYGAVKMSSVGKRRPRIDGKDLRAEKRAKLLQEKRKKLAEAATTRKVKDAEEALHGDESISEGSSVITGREDTFEATITSEMYESLDQFVPLEDDLDNLPFEERMMKMFEMLVSELDSADAVYHMASRVLEEDPKAWYHMKMALSKNDRIRYFVDGLRQPRFACDFLISMFGSVVKMMDTLEGALDGTIEDTRLLRLMLNSQEKTDTLLSEFGKARTLAQVILTEIVPPNKNTHYLLRDALRCYSGAVDVLATYIDDDVRLTEKLLRFVMTSNIKGLLEIRPMVVSKGRISRARLEEETAAMAAAAAAANLAQPLPTSDVLSVTHTEGSDQAPSDMPNQEATSQAEKKPRDRVDRMRRKTKTMKRKLPPLPKFSEAAWKAHLANRLNAAIEVCAETAAMKQVAVALNLDDQQELDESTQANAQGLIMSVFESRMVALQTICDALGCRMSSEALLNSALNMQRETLNAFLNSFETKETGMRMLEVLLQAKNNTIESLQLSAVTDDPAQWQPIDGIDRMLRFPHVLKEKMMAEVKKLKEKGLQIDPSEVLKCLETLLAMDEGTVNAINDCLMANRHPLAYNTVRMSRVDSLRLSGQMTDHLNSVITSNRRDIIKILATSFDSIHRTEREQKAAQMIDQMIVKSDKDITTDFLQNMASRFDTMQLLHRLERDRNKVLDFVRVQGPQRDLLQVYEAMDKVESLLQKAQRMTKVTIRLNEELLSAVTLSEEGDEAALKTQIHNILKDLHKAGIEMAMAMFDDAAKPDSYRRLLETTDRMPTEYGLQGFLEFMYSDDFKEHADEAAQPLINEMASTMRHMTRLATREEVYLVKKCVLLQCQRMILRTELRQGPTSDEKFAGKPGVLAVYRKLKEIVCRSEGKKAVMRALKEFLQTDEFKSVFDDMEMLLAHLIKKVENLPNNLLQTIKTAVAEHKAARKKEEKKKVDETSSQKKAKEKEPRSSIAKPSFASRLLPVPVEGKPAGAVAPPPSQQPPTTSRPPVGEEGEEEEVRKEKELAEKEETEEKKMPKPSSPAISSVASTSERSSLEKSALSTDITPQVTSDEAVDEAEAAIKSAAKEKKKAEASERRKKKKAKGAEATETYFEPLEIPTVDASSTSVKEEKKHRRPSQVKKHKKARPSKEAEAVSKAEDAEAEEAERKALDADHITRTQTIDMYTKDELRATMRELREEDEKMRLEQKKSEQKRQEEAEKMPKAPDLDLKPSKQLSEKQPEKIKKPKVKSDVDTHEVSADDTGLTFREIDYSEMDTAAASVQLGMIGDLQWSISTQESEQTIVTSEMKLQPQRTTSTKKDRVSEDIVDKEPLLSEEMVVSLHEKVDIMPGEKKPPGRKKTREMTPEPVLPAQEAVDALRQVGLTPKTEQERIARVLSDIVTQSWFKAMRVDMKRKTLTVNNVCRALCEMLSATKKTDTFNNICQALETISEKLEIPDPVNNSIVKFFQSIISNVTDNQLPELAKTLQRTKSSKLDRLTMLRKTQLTQEKGRETYSRTLRILQTMDKLGAETRATKLELRRHFLSLFPTPALQQADVDKMTDEDLESFLKPAETVSHEMLPPSLDQKVVNIAKAVQRTGEIFGREADAYTGGISGGGGSGAGGIAPPVSPFIVTIGRQATKDLAMLPSGRELQPTESQTAEILHFTPQESRVEIREADVDRDVIQDGYDVENVARKELELQRTLFLFSDEKPFKGIVAESDLPLHDLALLHIEEEKKKLRVVDVDRARGKIMEDDYAYGHEIRKLPEMQLSTQDMTKTEKLLPGEELDYGERRVISLCKSKDERKPKKGIDHVKSEQLMEQAGGAKKVVHPMDQLQAKKDKKHKARQERQVLPGDEEKETKKVRKIGDLGEERLLTREEKIREREAEHLREQARSEAEGRAKEVLREAKPVLPSTIVTPTGSRVDVTPASTSTSFSKKPSRVLSDSGSPLSPTKEAQAALKDQAKLASMQHQPIRGFSEEGSELAQTDEESGTVEGGGLRRLATLELLDEQVVTTGVLERQFSRTSQRVMKERKEELETPSTLPEEEEEELEKLLDDDVELEAYKSRTEADSLDVEERDILRRLKASKAPIKRVTTQDAQKSHMSLKTRDLMEKLICKRSDSTLPGLMVQPAMAGAEAKPGEDAAETARLVAAKLTRTSSYALRRHKKSSILMPHVAAQAMVSGELMDVDMARSQRTTSVISGERKESARMSTLGRRRQESAVSAPSASTKAKAVQEDWRLLQAMRAIPAMQKDYKPNYAVLSRLPTYLKPEVQQRMLEQGRCTKELSRIAAIAVDRIERPEPTGLGGQTALTTALPAYSDPMFRPPSPVSLPFLPDPLSAEPTGPTTHDAGPGPAIPLPGKHPEAVVPPTPPCLRPSYVSAHDWGRISISRQAWRSGKYTFSHPRLPDKHCMFDALCATNAQAYGVHVGRHLVRCDLVKMISASIHETARKRIEKRLTKTKRGLHGASSIGVSTQR